MPTGALVSIGEYLATVYRPDCDFVDGVIEERNTPPFACIEILSPEDRLSRVRERINDYLSFGVSYVWLLDPATRKAFRWTKDGMQEVPELRTKNPEIAVTLNSLFED
jgi:Uma2 family endonuclease